MITRRHLSIAAGLAAAASLSAGALITSTAQAETSPAIGAAAPDFTVLDATGAEVALSSLADKTVVLEWTNHDCPYVKKHYNSANMQGLQSASAADDVVWLQVISSAPGKQGYLEPDAALAKNAERDAAPANVILDPDGTLGRLYDARTTPHMFVIDEGALAYAGAIDDKPTANINDVAIARNYVSEALTAVAAGTPPEVTQTRAYGCSIKYAS